MASVSVALWLTYLAMTSLLIYPCLANDKKSPSNTAVFAVNQLSARLHTTLATTNRYDNVFFSPFSICAAFAMLYEGARGISETQLAKVMGFGDKKVLRADFHSLIAAIEALSKDDDAKYKLSVANRLFGRDDVTYSDNFTDALNNLYGAPLEKLLGSKWQSAVDTINSFVAKHTGGKIVDLLSKDSIDADTSLVMISAIYFSAPWLVRFPSNATEEDDFTTSNDHKVVVDFMRVTSKFNYYERTPNDEDSMTIRIVDLPYDKGSAVMRIVLPARGTTLASTCSSRDYIALLKQLDSAEYDQLMRKREVDLRLPKFSFSEDVDLVSVLRGLGLKSVFDEKSADLSGILKDPADAAFRNLYVSYALHKADIRVSEEGTKAVAATGMTMTSRSAVVGATSPVRFVVDSPFLLYIIEKTTNSVLFAGSVNKIPAKNSVLNKSSYG